MTATIELDLEERRFARQRDQARANLTEAVGRLAALARPGSGGRLGPAAETLRRLVAELNGLDWDTPALNDRLHAITIELDRVTATVAVELGVPMTIRRRTDGRIAR